MILTADKKIISTFEGPGWYVYNSDTHDVIYGPYGDQLSASQASTSFDHEVVYLNEKGEHDDPPEGYTPTPPLGKAYI